MSTRHDHLQAALSRAVAEHLGVEGGDEFEEVRALRSGNPELLRLLGEYILYRHMMKSGKFKPYDADEENGSERIELREGDEER